VRPPGGGQAVDQTARRRIDLMRQRRHEARIVERRQRLAKVVADSDGPEGFGERALDAGQVLPSAIGLGGQRNRSHRWRGRRSRRPRAGSDRMPSVAA
jgi:hypothetical protein